MGSSLDGVGVLLRARLWSRGEFSARPELWTVGDRVAGQYKLIERLGFGALGEVFLAWDEWFEREVALKGFRLRDEHAQDERWARLFERDALATARLDHPNIVRLYQFGFHGVRPFLVLERLRGQTLAELLAREGAPGRPSKIRWLTTLAEALAHAHARGVVHRDLKPSNLFISEDGQLKVLDFGLAVVGEPSFVSGEALGWAANTLRDELGALPARTGTPQYMAPEQREGRVQDQRVDVWAFGAIAAELLSGALPTDNLALEQLRAQDQLGELILRCLAPERHERPSGFEEVLRALRGEAPPARVWGSRQSEERELIQAIEAGRLVSVVGPHGVGKSALVQRVVARSWRAIGRVCWCTDTLSGEEPLLAHIHRALGLTIERLPVAQQVAAALCETRTLIILDGGEAPRAQIAQALLLLQEVPELCIVYLQERPLGLEQELVVRLGPLGGELPEAPEHLLKHEQARVFLELARRHNPSLEVRSEDLSDLHRVLRQLGGLPIAMKVAAAQLRVRTLAELADALEAGHLSVLDPGASSAPGALRQALDQAWALLSPATRAVACQLAAFDVPCTLNEAAAVVDVPGVEEEIAQLLDRSILQLVEDGRLSMLAPIRRFVHEQIHHTLPDWPSWRAGEQTDGLEGAPHRLALLRASVAPLTPKHALFVSARRALASQDVRLAAFLCAALMSRLDDQGLVPEWEALIKTLLIQHRDALPEVLRASILVPLGEAYSARAQYEEARACWDEARGLHARHGARVRQAQATALTAMLELRVGRTEAASLLTQEAVALAEATGDPRARLIALSLHGVIAALADPPRSRALMREAVVLAEQLGDDATLARLLCNLGMTEQRFGQLKQARDTLIRAVVLCEAAGLRVAEVNCRGNLGWLEYSVGRWDEAHAHMSRAERQADAMGMRFSRALWRSNLASIDLYRGSFSRANAYLAEAIRFAEAAQDHPHRAMWRSKLAQLAVEMGRWDEAEALLREVIDELRALHARTIASDVSLAYLLICQGRLNEATPLIQHAKHDALGEANPSIHGEVLVYEALLHVERGEHDEGARVLARVADVTCGVPTSALTSLLHEALRVELLQRAGDAAALVEALQRGSAIARALRLHSQNTVARRWVTVTSR